MQCENAYLRCVGVVSCKSGQNAPNIYLSVSLIAAIERYAVVALAVTFSTYPCALSHLSPSLRVISCEYGDDPYIAKN